jgi:hypothetical protein
VAVHVASDAGVGADETFDPGNDTSTPRPVRSRRSIDADQGSQAGTIRFPSALAGACRQVPAPPITVTMTTGEIDRVGNFDRKRSRRRCAADVGRSRTRPEACNIARRDADQRNRRE